MQCEAQDLLPAVALPSKSELLGGPIQGQPAKGAACVERYGNPLLVLEGLEDAKLLAGAKMINGAAHVIA